MDSGGADPKCAVGDHTPPVVGLSAPLKKTSKFKQDKTTRGLMAPHKWNVGSPTKGARVRIHGLRSAPHFNNITATVLKHTPSGRVAVRFLVPDSKHQTLAARLSAPVSKKHQTLAVRPANLKPAPSTPCSGLLALKQCEDNAGDVVIPAGCGCSLRFRTSDRPTREGVDWIARHFVLWL